MAKRLALAWSFCVLAALAASADPALGQDKKKKAPAIDPNGEPKSFDKGDPARYAVWHGKKAWHLRTTTAKREHRFAGAVHVEGGTIESIHSARLEGKGDLKDRWKVNAARDKIDFDFQTDGDLDGIDFTVSSAARALRFNLHIDGKHHSERVYIGSAGRHPPTEVFTLPAHPKKKG